MNLIPAITLIIFLAAVAAGFCTLGYVCTRESYRIQACKHRAGGVAR